MTIHSRFEASLPQRMPVEIEWALVRARAVRLARNLVLTWIGLNALTWAPSVDADGNCNCPLCHPFSMQASAPKDSVDRVPLASLGLRPHAIMSILASREVVVALDMLMTHQNRFSQKQLKPVSRLKEDY